MRERTFFKLAAPKVMEGPTAQWSDVHQTCSAVAMLVRFKERIIVLFFLSHQNLFFQKTELRVIVLPVLLFMEKVAYHLEVPQGDCCLQRWSSNCQRMLWVPGPPSRVLDGLTSSPRCWAWPGPSPGRWATLGTSSCCWCTGMVTPRSLSGVGADRRYPDERKRASSSFGQ